MTQEFKTIGQCIDWLNVDKNQNDVFIITLLDNRQVKLMWGQKPPHNIFQIVAKDNDGDYFDIGYVASKCRDIGFINNRPYDMDFLQALMALEIKECEAVECNLKTFLDGYEKYEIFYLAISEFKSILWFYKDTLKNKCALTLNEDVRLHAKFRPYTPSKASEKA